MLDTMRAYTSSALVKLLMLLLVASFAVWGIGDVVRGQSNRYLVKVGEETISYAEFARAADRTERQLQAMGMEGVDRRAIEDQVLRRLIEEKMLSQRLRDNGLKVGDELLIGRLREAPLFQNDAGKFDPDLFKERLAMQRLTERAFLDELSADIRSSLFLASVDVQTLTPPSALAQLYAAAANEMRDVLLVSIPATSVTVATPSDEMNLDYYEANKELLYMQAERRTLEYVTFKRAALDKLAVEQVSDKDVAAHAKSMQMSVAEARTELLREARENIADEVSINIEDNIAAGDAVGEAVAKAGIAVQSKLLSDVTAEKPSRDALLHAIEQRGFALEDGETSGLEIGQGDVYFVVHVREVKAAEPKAYDAVKADVKSRTQQRARAKALKAKAEVVKKALEGNDDWRSVMREQKVIGRTVGGIKRPTEGTKGPLEPALAAAVFEHDAGDIAGPLMRENDAQLAKVLAVKPGRIDKNAKLSPELAQIQQQELMQRYFRELSQRYPVIVNEAMLQQIRQQRDGE